jgi:FkbH-like protein
VSDLNLGLQSVVFIDDSAIERARVRETLPEVLVPEWPEETMLYASTLLNLVCFDTPGISDEDRQRTRTYVSERERKDLRRRVASLDEWMESLRVKVVIEELNEANTKRTAQLLNKTNQMNLATRRMSESELRDWAGRQDHKVWVFRVSDRFGDLGLTGVASLEVRNRTGVIVDFILSCRAMGRRVEETMLHSIVAYGRTTGLCEIRAEYLPTPKNGPCLKFFSSSGLERNDHIFTWDLSRTFPAPQRVEIVQR